MYLALGIVSAIVERSRSGKGQVVDAAIVDGTLSLLTGLIGLHQAGLNSEQRGENILNSGAPYYDSYECADGSWISVAPLEDKFYKDFISRLSLVGPIPDRSDQSTWPHLRNMFAAKFKERTCDNWMALFAGSDCCVAPVLTTAQTLNCGIRCNADSGSSARRTAIR